MFMFLFALYHFSKALDFAEEDGTERSELGRTRWYKT